MATAAAVRLSKDTLGTTITTTDANLTIVACSDEIGSVDVQVTTTAAALVQCSGAVQGEAPAAYAVTVNAGENAEDIMPEDCGVGSGNDWSFGVARSGATNATIKLNASLR